MNVCVSDITGRKLTAAEGDRVAVDRHDEQGVGDLAVSQSGEIESAAAIIINLTLIVERNVNIGEAGAVGRDHIESIAGLSAVSSALENDCFIVKNKEVDTARDNIAYLQIAGMDIIAVIDLAGQFNVGLISRGEYRSVNGISLSGDDLGIPAREVVDKVVVSGLRGSRAVVLGGRAVFDIGVGLKHLAVIVLPGNGEGVAAERGDHP